MIKFTSFAKLFKHNFMLFFAIMMPTSPFTLNAQDFGKSQEVDFHGADGTTERMTFILCSPPLGVIGNENAKRYLIGKAEVSFHSLKSIAPDVYKSLTERWQDWQKQTNSTDQTLEKMLARPKSFPAVGLTLPEVANAVARFNSAIRANPLSNDKLSAIVLRIPTNLEWEHAMRSGQPQAIYPFINIWEQLDQASEKERGSFDLLWKSKYPEESNFDGSQVQVARLVEKYSPSDQRDYLALFSFFLRDLGRGSWEDEDPIDTLRFPDDVNATMVGDWGVFGAHRGFPEWVIMKSLQNEATVGWQEFRGQISQEEQTSLSMMFSMAGALRTSKLGGQQIADFWTNLSLSGGPKAKGTTEVSRLGAKFSETEDWWNDYYPSFRLVALETLRPDWFTFVRESANSTTLSTEARLKELEQYEPEIKRLSPRPNAELNVVKFYRALVNYQMENGAEAGKILREVAANSKDGEVKTSARSVLDRYKNNQSAAVPDSPKRPAQQVFLDSLASVMESDISLKQ